MVIDIRTKVLIKSGTPEMLYVELRAKSYKNCTNYTVNACAQKTLILIYAEHASEPHCQSMKLRNNNMMINIKI